MKHSDILEKLIKMDEDHGKWLFRLSDLITMFPSESRRNILQSLSRYSKLGTVLRVCRGVYSYHHARSRKKDIFALARFLKPGKFVYLSREVRLQHLGLITQVHVGYLSLMTDGRSQTFDTPYGRLKYTHTDVPWVKIKDKVNYNPLYCLMEANEDLAVHDLKRSRSQIQIGMYTEEKERRLLGEQLK